MDPALAYSSSSTLPKAKKRVQLLTVPVTAGDTLDPQQMCTYTSADVEMTSLIFTVAPGLC